MSYDIHIEQSYDAPVERVWQALTSSDSLAEWLMPNDFKAEVGHRFRFTGKPMPGWRGFVECEVIEVDPPRKLAFTWLGDEDWTRPTLVTFQLRDMGSQTLLIFDHTGFVDPWGKSASDMLSGGWKGILQKRLASRIGA
jgi:uncharacterized protein YndB with AHSA1/START domain